MIKNSTLLVLISLFCLNCYAQYPINGLVSYWQMNGNANDSMGTYNLISDGSLSFTAGKKTEAVSFTAGALYRADSITDVMYPSDDYTIAFWVKHDTSNATYNTFFEMGEAIFIRTLNRNVEFGMHYGPTVGGDYYLGAGPAGVDANWHHYALTYNSTKDSFSFYFDGMLYAGMHTTANHTSRFPLFCLGVGSENGAISYPVHKFKGMMDEVFFYHRSLSALELQSVMENYHFYATGLRKVTSDNQFSVYPNPTNGSITVKSLSHQNNEFLRYELINTLGQAIYSERISSNNTEISALSGQPEGLYILKIWNEDQIVGSYKLLLSNSAY